MSVRHSYGSVTVGSEWLRIVVPVAPITESAMISVVRVAARTLNGAVAVFFHPFVTN